MAEFDLQLEFPPFPSPVVTQASAEPDRSVEAGDRLLIGGSPHRRDSGPVPILDGFFDQARALCMPREDLRRYTLLALQRAHELSVNRLAAALQEALIGRVADQRMLEKILPGCWRPAPED